MACCAADSACLHMVCILVVLLTLYAVVQSGAVVQTGAGWCRVVQGGAEWCRVVQSGAE
jgi:hypothetical protein